MTHLQAYAQREGKTPDEVVQESLLEYLMLSQPGIVDPDTILPAYNSPEERQFLEELRSRIGASLSRQSISLAEEISSDRGE